MAQWKVRGFRIIQHQNDHWPPHVHVYQDDDYIGKFDILHRRWIEGPYHARNQAEKALCEWLESQNT